VRVAVDDHVARAADALAAVLVERDGLLALQDQLLVEDVDELEERHVLDGVVHLVVDEAALVVRAALAPDLQLQFHV
jgi:hypothetical protein